VRNQAGGPHTTGLSGHPAEAIVFGRKARAIAESLEGVPLRVMANLYLAGAYLSVLKVLSTRRPRRPSPARVTSAPVNMTERAGKC